MEKAKEPRDKRKEELGKQLVFKEIMDLDENFELNQRTKNNQDDDDFNYCFESIENKGIKIESKKTENNQNDNLSQLIKKNMEKKTIKEVQSVIFEVEEDKESSVYFNVDSFLPKASTTITKLIDEELETIDKSKECLKEEKEKEKKLKEIKEEATKIKLKEERLRGSAMGGIITNNLALKAKTLANTEHQILTKPKPKSISMEEKTLPKEETSETQDWDKVNLQRKLEEQANEDTINTLTYAKAWNTLKSQNLTTELSSIIREDTTHMNPISRFYKNYIKPTKLNDSLTHERDIILALMKVKVRTDFHSLMLERIYRLISIYTPKGISKSWVLIGFQSNAPETDIRGTGMFGVLQVLYFAETYSELMKRYFLVSIDEKQNFPLVVVMFGFTAMAAEALREGKLTSLCNTEKSVIKVVNSFYAAAIHQFMERWIKEKLVITNRDKVFTETSKYCKHNPDKLINNFSKLTST